MLLVDRGTNSFRDEQFRNFPQFVGPGDCLVLNDTRVVPARLHGKRNRPDGAEVEIFLLRPVEDDEKVWHALTKPAKRARTGDRILLAPDFTAEILEQGEMGERTVRLESADPIRTAIENHGSVPLPPYIHRTPGEEDRERYQTVFAAKRGSVAAPTAGLHFTRDILNRCQERGATLARVTLHVGLGTFAPLREGDLNEIELHEELWEIQRSQAALIREAKRIVCVGTTSVRTLETATLQQELEGSGSTRLFIRPGYQFRRAGAMLTNFHLPASSLLVLVCAFAGTDLAMSAYKHAVEARYRFFSYGDCMLIV